MATPSLRESFGDESPESLLHANLSELFHVLRFRDKQNVLLETLSNQIARGNVGRLVSRDLLVYLQHLRANNFESAHLYVHTIPTLRTLFTKDFLFDQDSK